MKQGQARCNVANSVVRSSTSGRVKRSSGGCFFEVAPLANWADGERVAAQLARPEG
jgi:hypothetical protein